MFTKDISSTYDKNLRYEWLVTNGIGGYASSTIIGSNTRKYHGLLVASLGKSMERIMTLSKINEYITIDGERFSLSSNECDGYVEKGYVYQTEFQRKYLPEFMYSIEGVEIAKKISMVYKQNKVVIRYNIANNKDAICYLSLIPLVNYRSFHTVQNAYNYMQDYYKDLLTIKVDNRYKLFIKVTNSEYTEYKDTFYNNMYYREERSRGFDSNENLFMSGEFKIQLLPHEVTEVYVVAELNDRSSINDDEIPSLIRAEETRLDKICKIAAQKEDLPKDLVIASDQFVVTKGAEKSIIAGYPWFSDWGRDTFVAMEGLLLKTNRFTEAKSILKYFAGHVKNGLLPNYIDENDGKAYNTVDASLWYIEAAGKYYKYTKDLNTIKELYPKLLEIVYSYMIGTDFGIAMDDDGLIKAGDSTTQLTWMDAKSGNFVFTPRYGKAVEINALWYNALETIRELNNSLKSKFCSELPDNASSKDILNAIYLLDDKDKETEFDENITKDLFLSDKASTYYDLLTIIFNGELSSKVKEAFKKFYAENGLFDTIEPFSEKIRPNQLMAISLSYPVVFGDKAKEVLELVKNRLLTNKGIKTLDSNDSSYVPRYHGNSFTRDSAYHQGTCWMWLLGEYAKAYNYVYKKKFTINNVKELLEEGCIGSIAEIYDADEPRYPNGALAQAWSVSAINLIVL